MGDLVKQGTLEALTYLLAGSDIQILSVILEAVDHILGAQWEKEENNPVTQFESIGGLKKLEALQLHPNGEIYQKTVNLMDKYYQIQEVGDRNEGQPSSISGGQF